MFKHLSGFSQILAWLGVAVAGTVVLAVIAGLWHNRSRPGYTSPETQWIETWQRMPMRVEEPIIARARRLAGDCLSKVMEDRVAVPAATEIVERPECRDFRRDALEVDVRWPDRYGQNDHAWRWSVTPSETPSRWSARAPGRGAGFLITYRPDARIERPGPIVELDASDLMRVRQTDSSPSRILDTPVPAMRRLRQCLLAMPDSILDDPGWSAIVSMRRWCRDLYVTGPKSAARLEDPLWPAPDERLRVSLQNPPGTGDVFGGRYEVYLRVIARRRYELRSRIHLRRYLVTAEGTVHVTTADRDAEALDAAPTACEVDPRVTCDP